MQLTEFINSLQQDRPNADFPVHLKALWYDKKGDWQQAHDLVDSLTDSDSSWVHAYLHRVEGDSWNADYWYRKAGRHRPNVNLEEEWKTIVQTLLSATDSH